MEAPPRATHTPGGRPATLRTPPARVAPRRASPDSVHIDGLLGRRRAASWGGRRRHVRRQLRAQAADKVIVGRLVVPVVLPLPLGGAVGRGGRLHPTCMGGRGKNTGDASTSQHSIETRLGSGMVSNGHDTRKKKKREGCPSAGARPDQYKRGPDDQAHTTHDR